MTEALYDDPAFFRRYRQMRLRPRGLTRTWNSTLATILLVMNRFGCPGKALPLRGRCY
jgi:hypothetical protein